MKKRSGGRRAAVARVIALPPALQKSPLGRRRRQPPPLTGGDWLVGPEAAGDAGESLDNRVAKALPTKKRFMQRLGVDAAPAVDSLQKDNQSAPREETCRPASAAMAAAAWHLLVLQSARGATVRRAQNVTLPASAEKPAEPRAVVCEGDAALEGLSAPEERSAPLKQLMLLRWASDRDAEAGPWHSSWARAALETTPATAAAEWAAAVTAAAAAPPAGPLSISSAETFVGSFEDRTVPPAQERKSLPCEAVGGEFLTSAV